MNIDKILLYYLIGPILPFEMKRLLKEIYAFLTGSELNTAINRMKLNEDFVKSTNISKRHELLLKKRNTKNSHRHHYYNITSGIGQFILEVLDKSTAAFSIEPRYPFFDVRLIEFCLSLPNEQKLFDGWDRIILRRSMDGILPPEVQWRRKKANLSHNFKNSFILYEKNNMKKVLLNNSKIQKFVKIENLNNYYESEIYNNTLSIWKSANIALWLNRTYFH